MAKSILLAILLLASTAHATAIYTWNGTCSISCVGTAHVTAVLPDGYKAGDLFGADPSLFTYTDSNGTMSPNVVDRLFEAGTLLLPPGSPPWGLPPSPVFFWWEFFADNAFKVFADGSWQMHWELNNTADRIDQRVYVASGLTSQWFLNGVPIGVAAVPEPPVWSLLLLGGLFLLRRRRVVQP